VQPGNRYGKRPTEQQQDGEEAQEGHIRAEAFLIGLGPAHASRHHDPATRQRKK
jgi:hypothetical protein